VLLSLPVERKGNVRRVLRERSPRFERVVEYSLKQRRGTVRLIKMYNDSALRRKRGGPWKKEPVIYEKERKMGLGAGCNLQHWEMKCLREGSETNYEKPLPKEKSPPRDKGTPEGCAGAGRQSLIRGGARAHREQAAKSTKNGYEDLQ